MRRTKKNEFRKIKDHDLLDSMWEQIQDSNRSINVDTISDLAKTCGVLDGKWLFHVDSGGKADHLWSLVANGIVKGLIPSHSAKISPLDDLADRTNKYEHVVCVYNDNYLDEEQVLLCESGLRKIGIKCPLFYKPDVYTHLGIYRDNEWDLRPTIYRSNYDILSGHSKIDFSSAPGHR